MLTRVSSSKDDSDVAFFYDLNAGALEGQC